jgi:hypothetical protein
VSVKRKSHFVKEQIMLGKGQLIIGVAAVVAIVSFFLPWWTAPALQPDEQDSSGGLRISLQDDTSSGAATSTMSGWERATTPRQSLQVVFGATPMPAEVGRSRAPFLLGVLLADIGCLISIILVALGRITAIKSAQICVVLAGLSLILLAITVLQDLSFPGLLGQNFPLFWHAQLGIFLTILANVVMISRGFHEVLQ